MTVRELGARLTARELAEWVAYCALEPFGPDAEDVRWARLTAHQQRATGKVKTYLLGESGPKPMTPEQRDMHLLAGFSAMAAAQKRRKRKH